MANSQKVEFTINIGGNAVRGVAQLSNAVDNATKKAKGLGAAFSKIGSIGHGLMGVFYSVEKIVGVLNSFTEASNAQNLAESRLQKVMRNTMEASDDEYRSILALTSAQQKLGVIGDEVQIAGAQELGTYVTKTDTLKGLIPVMNDMLAQQYGINASQEQAVQIGSMIGKVMNGQVGALSRYGYKFDDAQEKIIKYGTEAQKMKAVIDIVSESVGGMNEALAQTPEGRIQQMENRIGDLKEVVGNVFTQLKVAAMPIAELGVGLMERLSPILDNVVEPVQQGVRIIMDLINRLKPTLQNMIGSVGNMVKAIKVNMSGIKDYANILSRAIWAKFLPMLQEIWRMLTDVLGKLIAFIANSELLKGVFGFIVGAVAKVAGIVKWLFGVVEKLFNSIILPVLNGIEKVYRFVSRKRGSADNPNAGKTSSTITPAKIPGIGTMSSGSIASAAVPSAAATGAAETAKGGTRNTAITINLGKFFDNMVFNGGVRDNVNEIQSVVEECLLRTLNAATSIG